MADEKQEERTPVHTPTRHPVPPPSPPSNDATIQLEISGIGNVVKTTCTGVEMFKKLLDQGQAGDNIGALLRGLKREDVQRGQVKCPCCCCRCCAFCSCSRLSQLRVVCSGRHRLEHGLGCGERTGVCREKAIRWLLQRVRAACGHHPRET